MANDTIGMTSGYPYPLPFQPQAKARMKVQGQIVKKPIAKKKRPVISKGRGSKSHSKKGWK